MDIRKFAMSSILGGTAYFFATWLVYGVLLFDLTALPEDVRAVIQYPPEEFRMSLMIVSCLVIGGLYALILNWAQGASFASGFRVCAIVGALITLAVGLSMASMFRMNTLDQIAINTVADALCSGLAGGVIGYYLGR